LNRTVIGPPVSIALRKRWCAFSGVTTDSSFRSFTIMTRHPRFTPSDAAIESGCTLITIPP
jgi:hypothetical protein